jgi:hypothetical protein
VRLGEVWGMQIYSWCKGKSDGERGRNDLQVGHMTLLPGCTRSHIRCD